MAVSCPSIESCWPAVPFKRLLRWKPSGSRHPVFMTKVSTFAGKVADAPVKFLYVMRDRAQEG